MLVVGEPFGHLCDLLLLLQTRTRRLSIVCRVFSAATLAPPP
jgi:hypothetical protein